MPHGKRKRGGFSHGIRRYRRRTVRRCVHRGGNKAGDVPISVEIADTRVNTIEELLAILRRLRANDIVDIRILRADDELLLEVELGKLE